MQRIEYEHLRLIKPEEIEIDVYEGFYTRRGHTESDWQNLLEIAKATTRILPKEVCGQKLTETEQLAKKLYFGADKPNVQIGENGRIEVSDGKHRMLALKESGTALHLWVKSTMWLIPLQVKDAKIVTADEQEFMAKSSQNIDFKNIAKDSRDFSRVRNWLFVCQYSHTRTSSS